MPRPSRPERAKNFKEAIKRLWKELTSFRVFITIGLFLAALGSILSIMAPNQLSLLVDQISEGLVIRTDNLKMLFEHVQNSFNVEKMMEVIHMDFSEKTVAQIMNDDSLTTQEKQDVSHFLQVISQNQPEEILNEFQKLSDSVLKILLPESKYQDVVLSTQDKISFINFISSWQQGKKDNLVIPDTIAEILFEPIMIDGTIVTSFDQKEFLQTMGSIDETDMTSLYARLDEMPQSIQKIVEPVFQMDKIKQIVLILIIFYLLSALFTYIESISMTVVSNRFAKKLRSQIDTKINRLPLTYFDKNQTGDILSRVTNDVDTIVQSMNQSFSMIVSASTLFLGTIVMMFWTNSIMALTAIGASFIGFLLMFSILSKSQKYFVQRQKYLGMINSHIEEIYSGLNVVKVYNGKRKANEEFDSLNEKVYQANRKSQFLSGLMMPIMNFIGNFGYVAVCIVGALLTMNGQITFGVIVAFMTYVRLFTSPLSQIGQAMTALQTTAAASERVFEFIDEKEMSSQKNVSKTLEKSEVKGNILFENVSFTYEGNLCPTIKNFSANVKSGQKIAIVGPTGAGKTTMVNLLMKFYEINEGDIQIDGVSTKDLSRENVHQLFTMVLQDTWLFDGTIKENIIFNQENVSDERVKEVCKIVGLDHFIKTLPNGYDSKVSENDNISAGQRQLLTIARGMILNAPFLILDEATSNVDTRTEELVQKAMDELMKGKTSFIIAHRLSTIKNADLILVMKDGNIVEQGTHEELMNQNGFYATLYNSQFEL